MKFIWPIKTPRIVTRDFYFKDSLYIGGQHAAVDIICDNRLTTGEPVLAIADGVAYASPIKDYYSGWNVYIEHDGGWRSGYRHFEHQILPPGQPNPVKQGDTIGYADSTGVVTGPHLHFDLWNRDKLSPEAFYKVGWWAHDPELYLSDEEVDLTPEESQMLKDLHNWVSSGDASPYRILEDPRGTGSLWVVAFGKKRHIVSMAALRLSGYHEGEIENLADVGGPNWAADFDSIPEF